MTAHKLETTESKCLQMQNKLLQEQHDETGFSIRRYNTGSAGVPECSSLHHVLSLNCSDAIFVSCNRGGSWTKSLCATGNIVTLTPAVVYNEVHVFDQYDKLEISFEPSFIDRIFEKENLQLQCQHNIQDFLLRDIGEKFCEGTLDRSLTHLYTQSLAITCAIHLATNYSTSQKKIFAPKGKLSSHQLKKLIDFVRLNINNVITLDEMAASVYLSVFHFSRLFKNTLGISPYQFVLNMKVDYAKKLIRNKKSISDIAHALAFTDSAHFCNAFKKLTGYSPLQFNAM